jgi:hypothetical protein
MVDFAVGVLSSHKRCIETIPTICHSASSYDCDINTIGQNLLSKENIICANSWNLYEIVSPLGHFDKPITKLIKIITLKRCLQLAWHARYV